MYVCKNCGNKEKFIGFAEEKGSAIIYQNPENMADNNFVKDSFPAKSLDVGNKSHNEKPKNFNYKDYAWLYTISDNSWKGRIKILKCYYCLSDRIGVL